jgi:hypothetical protein
MKKNWHLYLISMGIILLIGGFIYDVMFAGIPYQDPTPILQANYDRHSGIASSIMQAGAALFSLGLASLIFRRVLKGFSPTKSP